jgi:multidrug efflux pump subunit AcrB
MPSRKTFFIQPADMVIQILNFGLADRAGRRAQGRLRPAKNLQVAEQLRQRIAAFPGIADAHFQQEVNGPELFADIDRSRAAELGLNVDQIASNLNISLSSSEQVAPNFWTDPKSGIPYFLAVQTPEFRVDSLNQLTNTPASETLTTQSQQAPGLVDNVVTLSRAVMPTNANQENIQPVYDVYANVQDRDLGSSVAGAIDQVVGSLRGRLSPGNSIQVLGQHERRLSRHGRRPVVRRCLCLPADGRELPKFRRSIRRHSGLAGDLLRHGYDALHYRHDIERALVEGAIMAGRCRFGQFDPAGDLRPGAAA